MLTFMNDGQNLTDTNFWTSEYCALGYAYLSFNAGAARLLLPDLIRWTLAEITAADYPIISINQPTHTSTSPAIEILFEDNSDSPFAMYISREQCDLLPSPIHHGGEIPLLIYTKNGIERRLTSKYRLVSKIPCLDKWEEKRSWQNT